MHRINSTAARAAALVTLFGLCWLFAGTALGASIRDGELAAQEENWVTALSNWRPLAEAGNARAQFYLAGVYEQGLGVPRDPNAAVEWLIKSARNGYPLAQFNLGNSLYKRATEKDYEQAALWWNAAAEQGFFPAQYNLAVLFEKGIGVVKDLDKAVSWYQAAAKLGSEPAQAALERLGVGATTPPRQAVAATTAGAPGGPAKGPDWVLAQPAGDYTIQLASNRQPENAQALAKRFAEHGAVALVSYADAQGVQWHVVVLGAFDAKSAADALAQSIQDQLGAEPWVRTFAGIQRLL